MGHFDLSIENLCFLRIDFFVTVSHLRQRMCVVLDLRIGPKLSNGGDMQSISTGHSCAQALFLSNNSSICNYGCLSMCSM
mmetsp:Transcript_86400/g.144215  ORF Transcript_86400/g.144215 Transcript_86400/m.144215 type:complete len:80 (+) Transcript_86400:63-302(+)